MTTKPPTRSPRNKTPPSKGLPPWLTAIVVLVLLGLFVYNIVVLGPDGLPNSYLIAALLGGYAGVDQLLKKRDEDDK